MDRVFLVWLFSLIGTFLVIIRGRIEIIVKIFTFFSFLALSFFFYPELKIFFYKFKFSIDFFINLLWEFLKLFLFFIVLFFPYYTIKAFFMADEIAAEKGLKALNIVLWFILLLMGAIHFMGKENLLKIKKFFETLLYG